MSLEQLMIFGEEKVIFFQGYMSWDDPHAPASGPTPMCILVWSGLSGYFQNDKNREHIKEEYGKEHTCEKFGVTNTEMTCEDGGGGFGPNIIYMYEN